jgi:hypothetical protein
MHWQYRDIHVDTQISLIQNGHRFLAPTSGGESLDHSLLKASVAARLLGWGYSWDRIHWEDTHPSVDSRFRADLYAEGEGELPSFWFECIGTEAQKLRAIIKSLPSFRVVRVVQAQWFESVWEGRSAGLVDGVARKLAEKERKQIISRERESVIPFEAECWAVNLRTITPRLAYAVRRDADGKFVYLDSEEGYSLSSFHYVPRRTGCFRPLIPRILGSDQWRGGSRRGAEGSEPRSAVKHVPSNALDD